MPRRFQIFTANSFLAGLVLLINLALNSCTKDSPKESFVDEALVENGVQWAYGRASLQQTSENSFDTSLILGRREVGPGASSKISLAGFYSVPVEAEFGTGAEIDYVDFETGREGRAAKLLSFVVDFRFRLQPESINTYDVRAILKRAGASWPDRKEIQLGTLGFVSEKATIGRFFPVTQGARLGIFAIDDGVHAGRWALSFARVSASDSGLGCRFIELLPGFLPNQLRKFLAPDGCLIHRSKIDLCRTVGSSPDCRVSRMDQPDVEIAKLSNTPFNGTVSGDNVVKDTDPSGSENASVFTVSGEAATVRIHFVSQKIAVTSTVSGQALCEARFSAHTKAIDGRAIARGCRVLRATGPAPVIGAALTCAVEVSFLKAESALERDCFVQGVFWDESSEIQAVHLRNAQ